ncbi:MULTISPECIES: hypothetical protein [unclassified Mameliella]|uniref:hypothetical protein n=1 Tax=unclassified Mameliella TaxID=2630630 RepID=UPI00273D6296|nr:MULTISPECIES: hypothetical protein [unclassified Mameliella]
MASPAEVANDMSAYARFWDGRDRRIERVCRDAARVIRSLLAGDRIDGRTWGGLHRRLLDMETASWMEREAPSMCWHLTRARTTIESLRAGARAA